MELRAQAIDKGILRLRMSENFAPSLLERYGVLHTEPAGCESGIEWNGQEIRLPNGRSLCFSFRTEENAQEWQEKLEKLKNRFSEHCAGQRVIIGDPNGTTRNNAPVERGVHTPFGISISILPGERFYGLGEGNSERLNLRGHTYQNWAYYQFDEAPIPFLMSQEGWGILINNDWKHFVDVGESRADRLEILGEDGELDLFLLWGGSMAGVLKKYARLSGHNMLLPKWAYGLTYIAPIYATEFVVTDHARLFREKHIPCDMVSLEPGWMTKFYDHGLDKQWEKTRFHVPNWGPADQPHPESFIAALKRYGFHLKLWLCVDHDLTAEEERIVRGEETCDPPAWFDHLVPFVRQGVDAFKIDPCELVYEVHPDMNYKNGACDEQMHNLNQTLIVKQMYQGFAKTMGRRPMHHYCGGYTGCQRWGAMTTGDNGGRQGALTWILNLALSGAMNTTCDMDVSSVEAIHFGLLLPWGHLNSWIGFSQPWWAGEENERAFTEYARLRYRLLSYLYSAALEGHEEDMPIVRPMPLAFPESEELADCITQFMLGPWLMVTVFETQVTFPEGEWEDFFTGERYCGPCTVPYTPPAGKGGGLFVRRGAIVPMWKDRDYVYQYDDSEIELDVYPLGESCYVFREDDGISLDYENRQSCRTEIFCRADAEKVELTIGERVGEYAGKAEKRIWKVRVHGDQAPVVIRKQSETDEVILL